MIGDDSFEKNQKNSKDFQTNEEMTGIVKLYNFFFNTLKKKDTNSFVICLLIIIQTIQLVSYGFSDPHLDLWKIKEKKMKNINVIVGAVRIVPLFRYLKFNIFLIIWAVFVAILFIFVLLISMAIKFNKSNSTFYKIVTSLSRYFATFVLIVGLIPIFEIILSMVKCKDGVISILKDEKECWKGIHILYSALTIIFSLLLFIVYLLFEIFFFNPFNQKNTTTKISTSADIFFCVMCVINSIRYIVISNQWISIALILIESLFNMKTGFYEPTYGNFLIQSFIMIRNSLFVWTGFMLMICKLTFTSSFDGFIYLFLFGIPLIIIACTICFKKESENFSVTNLSFGSSNEFLSRTKSVINIVGKFIDKYKSIETAKKGYDKNDIFLKGLISRHLETCISEDCPLKKYQENSGNYSIQKNCLLHYMNDQLLEGIKKFPNNKSITMTFIQFNYSNKFNLNAAKTYLSKLEKENNTITENYILFCIKQSVNSLSNKSNSGINGENEELEKMEEQTEHKFRKLKYLIENTTKIYGEFWGVLSTNLTNNLNLDKLFFLGNKLNSLLDEITKLWEKDLKTKKIDLENQSIVQLYVYFVREILRNKSKADEISKKLNEEQHFESKKNESDKFDADNLDVILEDQEYVIYCRTNEKGECSILQCSNSIVNLLGFTKQNLIGQKIETLMPSIFIGGHSKVIANKLKLLRKSNPGLTKASDKKQIFILPRTKVGYLLPVLAKFTIYNDDDFSNTFIIRCKLENKDPKSVYAFYILAKDDFTIDSFSSSALTMGLTMDLLKKYVVNLNILVRTEDNSDSINLIEKINEFEEEPKKVTWVYPDIIYPKNDTVRKNEENIEQLVSISRKKIFNLLITKMKFGDEEPVGYCLRFTSTDSRKSNIDLNDFKPNSTRLIMYDILKMNFIRAHVVTQKKNPNEEYFQKKKDISQTNEPTINEISKKATKKNKAKVKTSAGNSTDEEEDKESKDDTKNALTKEKILEYQGKSSNEINAFINSLKYYGSDVSLEKHRPNKEKYPAGKISEPNIKISISSFVKRIEEKLKAHPELRKNIKHGRDPSQPAQATPANNQNEPEISSIPSSITASTASSFNSDNNASSNDVNADVSLSLNHIFNEKSVTYIKIAAFIMFFLITAFISIEFGVSLYKTHKCAQYLNYLDDIYIILNSILYTKFFITEAIIASNTDYKTNNKTYAEMFGFNDSSYIIHCMEEMSDYRQKIADTTSLFSNATVSFSDEYYDYIDNLLIRIFTLSNSQETTEIINYETAINRIPTSIFYVSTVNDNYENINLKDRNAYELMMNLGNDYLLMIRNITFILAENAKDEAKSSKTLLIIFVLNFIVSAITLFVMWKLISRFIDDREKPVDLFLTIKKKKFEELKTTSENFLNKLLNKFFGNEETEEEESKIEYTTSNKNEDIIMITKFKQKNDYKQSIRNSSEYLMLFIQIALFLLCIEGYMTFKYFFIRKTLKNIKDYTDIFNITHYSESHLVLATNVFKSFYYNDSIPILNQTDTTNVYYETIINISDEIERLYTKTFETGSFLKGKYLDEFSNRMIGNITDMLDDINATDEDYRGTLENGFSCVSTRYFEMSKFLVVLYIKTNSSEEITDSSFCYKEKFVQVNKVLINVIRPWFDKMIDYIKDRFDDYKSQINLVIDSTYIILLIAVIVIYFLVWKSYEERLKSLLKTSVDLIKLIPEEIKREIVKKLNEEEEKNE